jgi:hypothetical protein
MRVPMWVAYSNRRICFSTGAVHGPCYASPTASVEVWIRVPTASKEDLGLQAKSLKSAASARTCG